MKKQKANDTYGRGPPFRGSFLMHCKQCFLLKGKINYYEKNI